MTLHISLQTKRWLFATGNRAPEASCMLSNDVSSIAVASVVALLHTLCSEWVPTSVHGFG
jgi:hypothetical protein